MNFKGTFKNKDTQLKYVQTSEPLNLYLPQWAIGILFFGF